MHGKELWRILDQVTEEILDQMRRDGFHVYYNFITGEPMDELRYNPLVWDISNGRCEQWAALASERIPGGARIAWINPDVNHCVLVYDGKFYRRGLSAWRGPVVAAAHVRGPSTGKARTMTGIWKLYDNSTGEVLAERDSEADIKIAYVMAINNGEVLEMNAYIEDEKGNQHAFNKNMSPPQWEPI